MQNHCILHVVLSLLLTEVCLGSHFRGGIIMWEHTAVAKQIKVTFRIAWRRSFASYMYCDENTKESGVLRGSGSMSCLSGCSGTVGTMQAKCTDYSVAEDWFSGENTYSYYSNAPTDEFTIGFTGYAWISLVYGGGDWRIAARVDLKKRSDTGTANNSPRSAVSPVFRVQYGCDTTIRIPVNDPDGDTVRCRWATAILNECEGVCGTFIGAVLDEKNCKIFYSAKDKLGWYAVALQVEDFASSISTEALSSVPLQFLVYIFSGNKPCDNKSEFLPPTRVDGSCVAVPFSTTFEESIIAKSGDDSTSITAINTVSPLGMKKSSLHVYSGADRSWYITVTWSPTTEQQGSNIFCFSATDSANIESEQRCITLLGGVSPPRVVEGSQSPSGDVLPLQTVWKIDFDSEFIRPKRSTYMYIYYGNDTLLSKIDVSTATQLKYPEHSVNRTLSITFPSGYSLPEKTRFYILLDEGVARGSAHCGAPSPAYRDKTFWTFQTTTTPDTTSAATTTDAELDQTTSTTAYSSTQTLETTTSTQETSDSTPSTTAITRTTSSTPVTISSDTSTSSASATSTDTSTIAPSITSTDTSAVTSTITSTESATIAPSITSTDTSVVTSEVTSTDTSTVSSKVTSTDTSVDTTTVTITDTQSTESVTLTTASASATSTDPSTIAPSITSTDTSAVTSNITSTESATIAPSITSTDTSVVTSEVTSTDTSTVSSKVTSTDTSVDTTTVTITDTQSTASVTLTTTSASATSTDTSTIAPSITSIDTSAVTSNITSTESATIAANVTSKVTSTDTSAVTSNITSTESATIAANITSTSAVTSKVTSTDTSTIAPSITSTDTSVVTTKVTSTDTSTISPNVTSTDTSTVSSKVTSTDTSTVSSKVTSTDTSVDTTTMTITDAQSTASVTLTTASASPTSTDTSTIAPSITSIDTSTVTSNITSTESATIAANITSTSAVTSKVTSTDTSTIALSITSTDTPAVTSNVTSTDTSAVTSKVTSTNTSTMKPNVSSTDTSTVSSKVTSTDASVDTTTVTITDTQSTASVTLTTATLKESEKRTSVTTRFDLNVNQDLQDTNQSAAVATAIREAMLNFFRIFFNIIDIKIRSMRSPSLTVEYDIITAISDSNATQKIPRAITYLLSGTVSYNGTIVTISSVQVKTTDGRWLNLTTTSTLCSIHETLNPCDLDQVCIETDGTVSCIYKEREDDITLMLGLAVGTGVFFLLVIVVIMIRIRVYSARTHKKKRPNSRRSFNGQSVFDADIMRGHPQYSNSTRTISSDGIPIINWHPFHGYVPELSRPQEEHKRPRKKHRHNGNNSNNENRTPQATSHTRQWSFDNNYFGYDSYNSVPGLSRSSQYHMYSWDLY